MAPDIIFHEEPPVRWLPGVYAERYGVATKGFVDGLGVMSSWTHFLLKSSTHVLLKYCESDRRKKQLALLDSFSAFRVVSFVSDHLTVNAGSCSAGQLKDSLYPLTYLKNNNGSPGNHEANEDQETPQKKARVEQVGPRPYLSSTTEDNGNVTGMFLIVLL